MAAAKTVEEELRPNLPAKIVVGSTTELAKQLMDDSPETYAAIVACMAAGETNRSLAKRLGLDPALLRKIRELHPQAIEGGRKAYLSRLEEVAHNLVERWVENVDKIPPSQLGMNVGIAFDKLQLASGGATQRVEHIKAPTRAELDQMFDSLPEAKITEVETKKE